MDTAIVLDNSVLSALTNLGILENLFSLFTNIYISRSIFEEYSDKWNKSLPQKIEILNFSHGFTASPAGLSESDLDILELSIRKFSLLASDDRQLREFAKKYTVHVTGSLGLIREFYIQNIFGSVETYIKIRT